MDSHIKFATASSNIIVDDTFYVCKTKTRNNRTRKDEVVGYLKKKKKKKICPKSRSKLQYKKFKFSYFLSPVKLTF